MGAFEKLQDKLLALSGYAQVTHWFPSPHHSFRVLFVALGKQMELDFSLVYI